MRVLAEREFESTSSATSSSPRRRPKPTCARSRLHEDRHRNATESLKAEHDKVQEQLTRAQRSTGLSRNIGTIKREPSPLGRRTR